ncbi:MAG: hypothetical protein IKS62_04295 [Aeriscardovia sp.]|nr:hypothetical protein [Aeriscardovia sp.]
MKKSSSKFWKFLAYIFGALLVGGICYYVYKQRNPKYDPWEEPWENSSFPVDLGLNPDDAKGDKDTDEPADASGDAASDDAASDDAE